MLQAAPSLTFTVDETISIFEGGIVFPVNLGPSLSLAKGTLLGLRASAQNHILTISDTPTITAGTWTFTGKSPLLGLQVTSDALAYNISNANLQAALELIYGSGNVAVAGSGLPGNDTTITFQGDLAGMPVELPTISNTGLTGGTLAIAATQVGRSAFTYDAYSTLKLANPATAPNPSGTGTGGGFAAGSYLVTYTLVTAEGETAESPADSVALTDDQNLRVAAISSLSTRVTAVNVYVNGFKVGSITPSSGTAAQTDFTNAGLTGTRAPQYNTTGAARCILPCAATSSTTGLITKGAQVQPYLGSAGEATIKAEFTGVFRTSEIVGLDADAVASMGARLLSGSLSDGFLLIPGC